MAHATRLPRIDTMRLTLRESTVQLHTDSELRIRPQFKLPDWLLLASWSFERLFSSFLKTFVSWANRYVGTQSCPTRTIPGHALYEKGVPGQKSVVLLVGSQEDRALAVPVTNR